MKREDVNEALSALLDAQLTSMGRGGNLHWFSFLRAGGEEYALHLQGAWRLCAGERMLLGSGDYWLPARADVDVFEADVIGSRMRDVNNAATMQLLGDGTRATAATGDAHGGFVLSFANGWTLEFFGDATPSEHGRSEHWRLFVRGSRGGHVIADNNGISVSGPWQPDER